MATSTSGGLLASTKSATKPVDYTKEINTLYQNTFGRDADQGGIAYYQNQLAGGRSITDVQKEIANSSEAAALRASATPANARAATTKATAVGYKPTDVTVNANASAANQLASITAKGSPLLTQAETEAKKAAAKSGLLNSTMAVGAGRQAVLATATPLAQQDASTYYDADKTTATQKTNAAAFKAGADNQVSLANASAENAMQQAFIQRDTQQSIADKQIKSQELTTDKQLASQQSIADKQLASQQTIAERDNDVKLKLQQIDTETKKALASMDAETKTKLQQMDAADKQLLQTNISAANAYAQLAQNLATISTSTNMDAAAKQQATDNQMATFRQQLQAIGKVSGLDLSQYFATISTPAASTPSTAPNSGTGTESSGRPGMNGSLSEYG